MIKRKDLPERIQLTENSGYDTLWKMFYCSRNDGECNWINDLPKNKAHCVRCGNKLTKVERFIIKMHRFGK